MVTITNTFQLPKIIADMVTNKKPKVIPTSDSELKRKILNLYKISGFFKNNDGDDLYTFDIDENIYVSTNENNTNYPIRAISNIVGMEPNLDIESKYNKYNDDEYASPILTVPYENGGRRVIIMGNSFLRAHFDLALLPAKEQIVSDEVMNNEESLPEKVYTVKNIATNLAFLYRNLMEESFCDRFASINIHYYRDKKDTASEDPFVDELYDEYMFYMVTGLVCATMDNIYENVCGLYSDLTKSQKIDKDIAMERLMCLSSILNDEFSIEEFFDHIFPKLKNVVEFLSDHKYISTLDSFGVVTDVVQIIANQERSK